MVKKIVVNVLALCCLLLLLTGCSKDKIDMDTPSLSFVMYNFEGVRI